VTYRADMWAAMEDDPSISVAELARRTYGSFATASQVKRDWQLIHAAPELASNLDLSEHAQAL
jgi:2-oxo-4-hydroxy-4-carboxy--5-ureidoimidazoline (OHCU) decarboxylase